VPRAQGGISTCCCAGELSHGVRGCRQADGGARDAGHPRPALGDQLQAQQRLGEPQAQRLDQLRLQLDPPVLRRDRATEP